MAKAVIAGSIFTILSAMASEFDVEVYDLCAGVNGLGIRNQTLNP